MSKSKLEQFKLKYEYLEDEPQLMEAIKKRRRKDWLEDIYKLYTTTLQQMKETASNAVYKQLQNDSYRLKQCKIKVQSLMAKKFAADRAKTGNKNRMYV